MCGIKQTVQHNRARTQDAAVALLNRAGWKLGAVCWHIKEPPAVPNVPNCQQRMRPNGQP